MNSAQRELIEGLFIKDCSFSLKWTLQAVTDTLSFQKKCK